MIAITSVAMAPTAPPIRVLVFKLPPEGDDVGD